MYSLEEIIAMNQSKATVGKSKIDSFIAALSPADLQITMDKLLIRQYEEADKKAHEALPAFIPTYDEIRNWYGYGKTKGEGKVFIAVEAQQKFYRYLMETCPHALGDFRDSDRACTQYARHACGQCMEEIARIIEK